MKIRIQYRVISSMQPMYGKGQFDEKLTCEMETVNKHA